MSTTPRPKVFICHCKQDVPAAADFYDQLVYAGAEPWMDKKNLVLGDDWEVEIKKAVAASDAFVPLLRPEFDEIGFRQKEVRWALEAVKLRPPGWGFIIPYIIEPCVLPDWCKPLHAGHLSQRTPYDEVLKAIEKHTRMTLIPANPTQARISALIKNLALANPEDRGDAIAALRQIGPEAIRAIEPLVGVFPDPKVGEFAAEAVASIGPTAIPVLIMALKNEVALVRRNAAFALWHMRQEAAESVSALISVLKDPDEDVRSTAAIALGQIGSGTAPVIASLLTATKDPDAWVRTKATYALGEIGLDGVEALVAVLKDVESDVRIDAARALGDAGPSAASAVPELLKLFNDTDREMRYWAVRSIGDIGSRQDDVIKALQAATGDEDEKVRQEAAKAIKHLLQDDEH